MPSEHDGPTPRSSTRVIAGDIDSAAIRRADRGTLSLALMDARNHTLHLLSLCETAAARGVPALEGVVGDPLWLAGHAGWFAEYWTGRNTQRHQGESCSARPTRLASTQPRADSWWGEGAQTLPEGARADVATTRGFLLEQLEGTLELLDKAPDDDAGLYFYRLALLHEDQRGEEMLVQAQTLGVAVPLPLREARRPSPALVVPARRWSLGSEPGGLVFDNEKWAHPVEVPEFEIDAQPVGWSQFVEFVDDGGYDRSELWHPQGWQWLEALAQGEGRRGPRYVEQIGVASGAVMQQRFGQPVRMAGHHSARHVSWWEADAWCRWAGRRLPAEVEWELAAHTASRQGFRWGEVWEWTGTTFGPYPGFVAGPWAAYSAPHFGYCKVLRGASFATRERMKHPRLRNFALPSSDHLFCGFRSCAL